MQRDIHRENRPPGSAGRRAAATIGSAAGPRRPAAGRGLPARAAFPERRRRSGRTASAAKTGKRIGGRLCQRAAGKAMVARRLVEAIASVLALLSRLRAAASVLPLCSRQCSAFPSPPSLSPRCLAGALSSRAEDFQGATHPVPYDEAPINYSAATPDDPIARLQARLDAGEAKLKFDNELGWLPALLDALKVPKSSQMLVFSKTSLQRTHITPQNPRAIYFNDDVYLGYIPGAPVMEISAVDPKLGGMFYSIEQLPARKPKFVRESGLPALPRVGAQARRAGAFRAFDRDRRDGRTRRAERVQPDRSLHAVRRALGRLVCHRHARRAGASRQSHRQGGVRGVRRRSRWRRATCARSTSSSTRRNTRKPAATSSR